MTEHDVLQQRISTLQGLLESPGGPFGAKGAPLAERLAGRWSTELKLIARILDDCPAGQDLQQTLDLWCDRTAAFISTSDDERPGWTDRQGQAWDAGEVLELLDDLKDRLKAWQPKPGDGASVPTVPKTADAQRGSSPTDPATAALDSVDPGKLISTGEPSRA